MSLLSVWTSIDSSSLVVGAYEATKLPGRRGDYLAVGEHGRPTLFIGIERSDSYLPPVRLKHLSADYRVECKVRDDEEPEAARQFAVIACCSDEPSTQRFFLSAVGPLIDQLPVEVGAGDVRSLIDRSIDLFRALERPSATSVAGLWGELAIVSAARSVDDWIVAWHDASNERYDFSFALTRVEVKSSLTERRVHDFSLSQLIDAEATVCWIASILLVRSSAGDCITDLAERICSRSCSNENKAKLWRIIAQTLGADFEDCGDAKFDLASAIRSIVMISSGNISRPIVSDARIDMVRFRFDATEAAIQCGVPFDGGEGFSQ